MADAQSVTEVTKQHVVNEEDTDEKDIHTINQDDETQLTTKDEDDKAQLTTKKDERTRTTIELNTSKKFFFGLFIVVFIALTWVGSTQTAKSTYNPSFNAPFFMVWFSTSWMVFCYPFLIPFYFIKVWLERRELFSSGILHGIRSTLLHMWR